MSAAGDFSDDLLREIFLRLPSPEALVHAALACKAWLRAASDAAFLRRFHALHPLSHLLGFLFIPHWSANHPTPFFLPATASLSDDLMAGSDFSLSFLPGGGWSSTWVIDDCRDGCILFRHRETQEFAIADPLSQRCIAVPPLPACFCTGDDGRRFLISYWFFLASGKDSASESSFRVVCVQLDGRAIRAIVFSSRTAAWHCHRWAHFPGQPWAIDLHCCVHVNQSLYWISWDTKNRRLQLLELDTTTMGFHMTDVLPAELLPGLQENPHDVRPVVMQDGRLGIVVATVGSLHVKLWVRGEGGGGADRWVLEKEVELQDEVRQITELPENRSLSVAGASRGMVFLSTSRNIFRHAAGRQHCILYMSLRLETMQLKMLGYYDICFTFHPYTIPRPPS